MNPFSEEIRWQYIKEHNGIVPATDAEREEELDINVINVDLDEPIYRYMTWQHLKDFYEEPTHGWVLINPQKWQDKYEHFIFKCEQFFNPRINAFVRLDHLASQYYAQCWTLNEESSLQWQVNKPHSNNADDNNIENNGGEIWVKALVSLKKC